MAADIGKALRIVIADRNVARSIDLVVINALVPGKAGHWIEVANPESVVRPADVDRDALKADICFDFVVRDNSSHGKRQSAVGNGCLRNPGRREEECFEIFYLHPGCDQPADLAKLVWPTVGLVSR